MTTQVLFDDKTLMTFITPDKVLHRLYPGIVKAAVPSYQMSHDEDGTDVLGQTVEIPANSQVLMYDPCYTSERTITVMGARSRHIFYLENGTLKYLKFSKFINMALDEATWEVILHFWVNIKSTSQGDTGFAAADDSDEPFDETTGETDVTMMRALAFSRGHYYGVWDNKDGVPRKWMPTFVFEPPQVVEVVGVWNPDNAAEQVLDIHNELNVH